MPGSSGHGPGFDMSTCINLRCSMKALKIFALAALYTGVGDFGVCRRAPAAPSPAQSQTRTAASSRAPQSWL